MVSWSIELCKYDIKFVLRGNIKSHILEDLQVEFSSLVNEKLPHTWILLVKDDSNLKRRGGMVVLEVSWNILMEKSFRFEFKASSNQVEYKTLIVGMNLVIEFSASNIRAWRDSQFIANQVAMEYQMKETHTVKYLKRMQDLAKNFKLFEMVNVPKE